MTDPNTNLLPNISLIRERAQLLRELRDFFDQRAFCEVQPPCLSRDCVVDPYIDPLHIESNQLALSDPTLPQKYFLQTSPELAMKRMLAAGAPSIYAITPVFRAGELGDMHNVEFTMLEWYEVGANMQNGVDRLAELSKRTLRTDHCEVVTYRQAFRNQVGIDPIEATLNQIRSCADGCGADISESIGDDRDGLLDLILSHKIQPRLLAPTILTDYPLSQAALAKSSESDPDCAARFELFAAGVELANGYDELLDADELIDRVSAANKKRTASGRDPLELPGSLIESMRGALPPCAGVALGVDRLLMVREGVKTIHQVIPFTSVTA